MPNFVFVTQVQHHTPYKRTVGDSKDGMNFEADRRTVARRIEQYVTQSRDVVGFYQRYYDNVRFIRSHKSKWFVQDSALGYVLTNLTTVGTLRKR